MTDSPRPLARGSSPYRTARSAPAGARPACWRFLCDACAPATLSIVDFFLLRCTEEKKQIFFFLVCVWGNTVFISSFPKAQERSYVFLRQKELQNRDQRKPACHCPFPSNCFHSNYSVDNAKQSQEEQNSFFLKRGCCERVKGRLLYEREILVPC